MSGTPQQTPGKFLAIGTSSPMTPEQRREHMLAEVTATLQLYLDGKIDQFWHRYDGKGVIFVMTTGSTAEAERLLGPLRPITALFDAAEAAGA